VKTDPRPGSNARRQHGVLITVFVVYLILLTWIVLWKLAVPSIGAAAFLPHPIKWVPFVASGDAGASNPLEVLANVVLFIPFGIYLRLLAPKWRSWKVVGIMVGTSLIFETTQQVLSIGSFDVSDVISNTAGGAVGLLLLMLIRRGLQARTLGVVTTIGVVATVLAIVAIGAYIASPLRYVDRQDVVVPLPGTSRPPS
jgi:glycopeptide antibiotics resistance protein